MVLGAVVVVAITGSPAALLPAFGCVLMMVVMMRMMGGMGRSRREAVPPAERESQHR